MILLYFASKCITHKLELNISCSFPFLLLLFSFVLVYHLHNTSCHGICFTQDQLRALPSLIRTTLIQQHYAYQKYSNNRNTESISTQNPQNSVEHKQSWTKRGHWSATKYGAHEFPLPPLHQVVYLLRSCEETGKNRLSKTNLSVTLRKPSTDLD